MLASTELDLQLTESVRNLNVRLILAFALTLLQLISKYALQARNSSIICQD